MTKNPRGNVETPGVHRLAHNRRIRTRERKPQPNREKIPTTKVARNPTVPGRQMNRQNPQAKAHKPTASNPVLRRKASKPKAMIKARVRSRVANNPETYREVIPREAKQILMT